MWNGRGQSSAVGLKNWALSAMGCACLMNGTDYDAVARRLCEPVGSNSINLRFDVSRRTLKIWRWTCRASGFESSERVTRRVGQ